VEPECGGGLLLARHVTPFTRRNMVYFSCGAYTVARNHRLRTQNHDLIDGGRATRLVPGLFIAFRKVG
jgi:hypothetical protein